MKSKKDKKRRGTQGRENLVLTEHGKTVTIKNRSALTSGIIGTVMVIASIIGVIGVGKTWDGPALWLVSAALILGLSHSAAKSFFGKIVLDTEKMTMTVYNPFAKEYKFEDVNYVERKNAKRSGGEKTFTVTAYIGSGKRSVEVASYSEEQSRKIEALMRGMLTYKSNVEIPESSADTNGDPVSNNDVVNDNKETDTNE